ncbi:MAG: CinA family protein [Neisseriaceae bacterium]
MSSEAFRELEELADLLIQRGWTIASAESCTGGLVASYLTELPGSSQWFKMGFITYSNASKAEILNVPSNLLTRYGPVSEQVALEMAKQTRLQARTDLAISTTGLAGPTGGLPTLPIGVVWFGIASCKYTEAYRVHFQGNRHSIRIQAAQQAIIFLLKWIQTC